MKAVAPLPDDDLLHRAVLGYASDYTLLESVLRRHSQSWAVGVKMASLDHAMWWHRPVRVDEWLLYVQSSPSAQGGRGLGIGRIFSQDGRLVGERRPGGHDPAAARRLTRQEWRLLRRCDEQATTLRAEARRLVSVRRQGLPRLRSPAAQPGVVGTQKRSLSPRWSSSTPPLDSITRRDAMLSASQVTRAGSIPRTSRDRQRTSQHLRRVPRAGARCAGRRSRCGRLLRAVARSACAGARCARGRSSPSTHHKVVQGT